MLEKLGIKKLFIIGIAFILIIIIIFGGALLYNKFLYSKSYPEIEDILENAAKDYFNQYEEKLPKTINNTITVTDKTLAKNNMMKDIDSYLKNKKATCAGEVSVTNINGKDYRYATTLDCGEDYKTQTFIDYINENVEIIETGEGLYDMESALVYRGDEVDNYLELNNNTYRIVKFVDGHAVIILTEATDITNWDDRYNDVTGGDTGINNYEISRVKTYLKNIYENDGENALLTKKTRLLITSHDVPIGKRINKDTDKSGELENAQVLSNQYASLLPISDFLNASLSEKCTNTDNVNCKNYNYLTRYKYSWWTATAYSNLTHKAYLIDGKEKHARTEVTSESAYIRPVFYLASDAIYVSGNGSKSEPYKVK